MITETKPNLRDKLQDPIVSENALKVLKERYLAKDDTGKIVEDPKGMYLRVATAIASPEKDKEYWTEEFYNLMAENKFMPNSPTLMNAGRRLGMLSACFVLPVADDLDEIFSSVKATALVQRAGGGTGFNFSNLRPSGSIVKSSGGTTAGPLSFIDVFSQATNTIQQGAFRRGANMGIMDIRHPNIINFIKAKSDLNRWQNYNISIAVPNGFMQELEVYPNNQHKVSHPEWGNGFLWVGYGEVRAFKEDDDPSFRSDAPWKPWSIQDTWNLICQRAWETGEPGLFFIDVANENNPVPSLGRIVATNPCVTGDTKILTSTGYREIKDTVDQKISIWSGTSWRECSPQVTGTNQKIVTVNFSDGSSLNCTRYHKFYIETGKNSRQSKVVAIEAKDLSAGMKLQKFSLPVVEGTDDSISDKLAYTRGVFCGDGSVETTRDRKTIWLYGDKRKLAPFLEYETVTTCEADRDFVKLAGTNWSKTWVPNSNYKVSIRLSYLAGLLDTDAGSCGNGAYSIWSIDKTFLEEVKLMCNCLGVITTLALGKEAETKMMPDGNGGLKQYDTQDCWRLTLSGTSIKSLVDLGLKTRRIDTSLVPSRDASRFIKVESVVDTGRIEETVYCFNEPIEGRGTFGCVVTAQCGEQPLHAYDSCNLGSINLVKYAPDEHIDNFDWDTFGQDIATCVRFLDNVIEVNKYPIPEIKEMSHKTRRIGLGVMGWADLLFKLNIKYDSEQALKFAEGISFFLNDAATHASKKLGEEKGSFGAWIGSRYEKSGTCMRNAYRTTVAPTGTISIIADCSGGIEPLFALAFKRTVMPDSSGKFKEMHEENRYWLAALESSSLDPESKKIVRERVQKDGNLNYFNTSGGSFDKIKNVFVTSHDISPSWHVRMQAAWQKGIDTAISKTINICHDAPIEVVSQAYLQAFALGCKGITVYRDGCRNNVAGMKQPMSVDKPTKPSPEPVKEPIATDVFPSFRTQIKTQFGNLHVHIVQDGNGKEREIFAQLGKAGDLIAADLEAICRMASLALKKGSTIEEVAEQLDGIGTTHIMPSGDGKIISMPDALAKAIRKYLKVIRNVQSNVEEARPSSAKRKQDSIQSQYGVKCPQCSIGKLEFSEGCQKCRSCGYSAC